MFQYTSVFTFSSPALIQTGNKKGLSPSCILSSFVARGTENVLLVSIFFLRFRLVFTEGVKLFIEKCPQQSAKSRLVVNPIQTGLFLAVPGLAWGVASNAPPPPLLQF